jgi:hypothetical protein
VHRLAVVHLVRKGNALGALEAFLRSYREHDAGLPHELVILFKGFRGGVDTREHERLLEGLDYRRDFIPDRGYDLQAYFGAARRLDYDYFCFLNSFSRILDEGWLAKLHRWASAPGVGLAGASGSWQSLAGGYGAQPPPEPGMPAPVLGAQVGWASRIVEGLRDGRPGMRRRRMLGLLVRASGVLRPGRNFAPFPNRHLRTNAFMGERSTLLRIRLGWMPIKFSAYKFESGLDGMTSQVLRLGLRVLVVGRDGEAYEPERWNMSRTFWQSRQENLLVADNQTEAFLAADPAAARYLSFCAWGTLARPA